MQIVITLSESEVVALVRDYIIKEFGPPDEGKVLSVTVSPNGAVGTIKDDPFASS